MCLTNVTVQKGRNRVTFVTFSPPNRTLKCPIFVSDLSTFETPKSAQKGLISLICGSQNLEFLGISRFATVGHRMGHVSHYRNHRNILVGLAGIAKVGHFGTMPFGVPNVPFAP